MLSSLENFSVWDDNRPAADVIEFVERMYYEIVYRVVQKNGATLHFPKYLENYWR